MPDYLKPEVTNLDKVTSGATEATIDDLNITNLDGVLRNNQQIINKPAGAGETEEEKKIREEAAVKAGELTEQQVADKITEIKAKEETTLTQEDKVFLTEHDKQGEETPEQRLAKEIKVIEDVKEEERTTEQKETLEKFNERKADDEKIKPILEKKEEERSEEEKKAIEDYKLKYASAPAVNQIRDHFGYEDLAKAEMPNTVEGIIELTEKIAEIRSGEKLNTIVAKFPEVAQLIQHRVAGKSLDTFLQANARTPDFERVELTKENAEQNKEMYRTFLAQSNIPAGDIATLLQAAEDAGEDELLTKAKAGQTAMVTAFKSEVAADASVEEAQVKELQKQQQQAWNEINIVLKSGEIAGNKIPLTEMREFEKAIKDDAGEGSTLIETLYAKLPMDRRALLDYIVWKDFNVKGFNLRPASSKIADLNTTLGLNNSQNLLGNLIDVEAPIEGDVNSLMFKPEEMRTSVL